MNHSWTRKLTKATLSMPTAKFTRYISLQTLIHHENKTHSWRENQFFLAIFSDGRTTQVLGADIRSMWPRRDRECWRHVNQMRALRSLPEKYAALASVEKWKANPLVPLFLAQQPPLKRGARKIKLHSLCLVVTVGDDC